MGKARAKPMELDGRPLASEGCGGWREDNEQGVRCMGHQFNLLGQSAYFTPAGIPLRFPSSQTEYRHLLTDFVPMVGISGHWSSAFPAVAGCAGAGSLRTIHT